MAYRWMILMNIVGRFLADTRGIVLPYVTVMLVVIVGVSVLALDGARYMSLQTQLQKAADALALAGAAELDRLPSSITRATNAVLNTPLVTNTTALGLAGNQNVTVASIRFLSALPANDALPIINVTTDPFQARYIEVTVTPVQIPTILPAAFFGGAATSTAGASAVAGFDQVVCAFTPMFICNPYETVGMTYDAATAALEAAIGDPAIKRRQILMRRGGGAGGQYSAGNYGFLDSPTSSGAAALRDAIARVRPPTCFRQSGVNTQPGFIASVRDALNVRFDIYEASMNSVRGNSEYRPSLNVRKGYVSSGGGGKGNPCNNIPSTDPTQAMGLPRDTAFPYMDGRMGNGIWDFDAYWKVNHTDAATSTMFTKPTVNGMAASNTNLPSRYQVYRYEIDQNYINHTSPGGENGAPACYSGAGLSDQPDRRIFYAAIVNCMSLPLGTGNETDVPVVAFARFFLTEPVDAAQDDIRAEMVDLVRPGDADGVDHPMVQLYR